MQRSLHDTLREDQVKDLRQIHWLPPTRQMVYPVSQEGLQCRLIHVLMAVILLKSILTKEIQFISTGLRVLLCRSLLPLSRLDVLWNWIYSFTRM